MIGSKWVLGLGILSLSVGMACGNTDNNGHGGTGKAGAGNGGSGANANAGSGNVAGTDASGSSSGGSLVTGGAADGGEASGGAPPIDLGERVELVRDQVPNKLDLLMMIDNSISMSDKQQLLADAMQHLVDRLIQPRCLDELGMATGQKASPKGVCPAGSQPEFLPFIDIHAAVITSSLGARGAPGAKDVCISADDDDHARLLGSIRPNLQSWNGSGFLVWDPGQALTPPGMNDPSEFAGAMAATVQAAGENGCGYEGTLEAWYRFLVDPEPPSAVALDGSVAKIQGTSAEVLAERDAFLRSDSVLGIVMLSDENDCSVLDEGYGWLVHRSAPMYRSTSECLANPNAECCQSCGEQARHDGCPAFSADVECQKGTTLAPVEDDLSLRCYHQKDRFGFDLLYPVQRYIDGLTSAQVKRRSDGASVPNPIYASRHGAPSRSPEQVLLLGIVGVPWQDVADSASLSGAGLKFLSEDGPLPENRWSLILGEPSADPPVAPLDPFMFETPADRTTLSGVPGAHPLLPSEKLVASSSTNPLANAINGHETNNSTVQDLQYACTFELPDPIVCDSARESSGKSCDCFDGDLMFNRALCQPPAGGAAASTQYYGKAYPGLRELSVLRGIGGHGIVASACPKSADANSETYGYRPAMDAMAGRVARQIGRSCLGTDAEADGQGRTACQLITASEVPTCGCDAQSGLQPAPAAVVQPVLEQLAAVGYCGPGMDCTKLCLCELDQLAGDDLASCQNDETPPDVPGFCYLNAVPGEVHAGDADLAADCVGAAPRRIRFTGGAPLESSIAVLYCAE